MLGVTHLLFGFSYGFITRLPVVIVMIGSILPDIDVAFDFFFPLVHRGVLHTPIAAAVIGTATYLATGKKSWGYAVTLGMLTHFFLDTITPMGIMWLYPFNTAFYSLDLVNAANLTANLVMIVFSLGMVGAWRWMRSE